MGRLAGIKLVLNILEHWPYYRGTVSNINAFLKVKVSFFPNWKRADIQTNVRGKKN